MNFDLKELTKYIIVGGTSALLESLFFVFFYSHLGLTILIANTLAFLIVFGYGFTLQKLWTFKSKSKKVHVEAFKFFLVVLVGFILNNFFVYFFVKILQITPFIGKLMQVGIVFFWNYFAQKKWVFGTNEAKSI